VMNPRKDPIAAAKAANARWKLRVQEAISNDSFSKGLDGVDIDMMYQMIQAAGEQSFVQGIAIRAPKIAAAIAKLQPLVLAMKKALDAMPCVTDTEREAKMIAAKRGMQAIGKQYKTIK